MGRRHLLLVVLAAFGSAALVACGAGATPPLPPLVSPAAAPAPTPPAATPTCPASGEGIGVEPDRLVSPGVLFDLYQGTVAPDGLAVVDAVARRLLACPDVELEVEVHTDTVRASEFNLRGSQRVADAVRARLVADGVPEARVAACGYGESRPLSAQPSWDMRSPNARVEWHRLTAPAATFACPAVTP